MMTARERIILLRMLEKQEKNAKYMEKIGVQVRMSQRPAAVSERGKDV